MAVAWRVVAVVALWATSLTVFDLNGRQFYNWLMDVSAVSIGAMALAACLAHIRWRRLA